MNTKAIFLALLALIGLTACNETPNAPDTENYLLTATKSIGETNSTIAKVKAKYCASNQGAEYPLSATNFYTKVKDDVIIEGVVCANDVSGNLYQTLILRDVNADGTDQCIQLGIKTTALYPFFPLGQRLKINLKGLYIGVYSKTPKIGQPYYTSAGNPRLGPMLINLCETNIEKLGAPNPKAPELVPVDLTSKEGDAWLRASANRSYENSPMLATVRGSIKEVQAPADTVAAMGDVTKKYEQLFVVKNNMLVPAEKPYAGQNVLKIFGPEPLHDAGYGIDRTIQLQSNTSSVTVRTSTRNAISFLPIPKDVRNYTGVLSFYTTWQLQLRTPEDINPQVKLSDFTNTK